MRSRRRMPRVLSGLLYPVLLGGCILPDQVSRLEKDVADMQQRLIEIQQEQGKSRDRLAGIESKVGGGEEVKRSEFADLKVLLEEIDRRIARMDERVNEAHRRMDRLSQNVQETREVARSLAASAPPRGAADAGAEAAPPAAPSTPGAVPSPEALYNVAYADFSKGNFALSVSGFEEYAGRFPDSDLADNALYWIGECRFSQGDYGVSIEAFDQLLERYPESDRAAAANLKKGLAYLELNQVSQAIVQLRDVVGAYPQSDEARIAREKLASLGPTRP